VSFIRRRWVGYGAIALNAIALYVSGSRGALLGAITLALVTFVLILFKGALKTRRQWIAVALVGLLLIAVPLSNPRVRSLITVSPSASNSGFSLEQLADGPTKDRLYMLQAGQRIFSTHPFLGIGPGNLSRVYNLYRPPAVGGGLELVQQLHNTPAQLLAELGLLGATSCALGLGWLIATGLRLHRRITQPQDRILLWSLAASGFGYGVSSLTDYQLENIGIASTLVIAITLLINLADSYLTQIPAARLNHEPTANLNSDLKDDSFDGTNDTKITCPSGALSQPTRRLLSLLLLLYISLAFQLWTRADVGFYLANAAKGDVESLSVADADTKWSKAGSLVPWDPTYGALAAEQLIDVQSATETEKLQNIITKAAIASLQSALKAAPNDPWLNQNLATLLLKNEPQKAEAYLRRTALLMPRSQHYTYYTLADACLKQQKTAEANSALVLESLANPSFLVDPLWQKAPFVEILPDVVDQTLTLWLALLPQTAPQSPQYAWLTQQIAILQWWHRRPLSLSAAAIEQLPPLTQVILKIEENPTLAAMRIAELIKQSSEPETINFALLQAWLLPDKYLSQFFKNFEITTAEKQIISDNIRQHRDLRQWLTSVTESATQNKRFGLTFAYRNAAANDLRQVLFSQGPSTSQLLDQLAILTGPPREFPQLDSQLVNFAAQSLGLIPPEKTHFKPPSLP
jgi:putative inorganic carbon (hco3(-)) transporter